MSGGLGYATAYYHAGYRQQNSGLLFQPFVTPYLLWSPTERVVIQPYLTLWNSTSVVDGQKQLVETSSVEIPGHSHGPAGQLRRLEQPQALLELMGGVYLTAGDLSLDVKYAWYNASPFTAFAPIQEVGGKLNYDVLGSGRDPSSSYAIGLKPFAAVYYETQNSRPRQGTYAETGIEPFIRCGVCGKRAAVSLPLFVGLSVNDYYVNATGTNEPFGYAAGGVTFGIPVYESSKFGSCFFSVSGQYLYFSADSLRFANGGDPNGFIGKLGIGFSY